MVALFFSGMGKQFLKGTCVFPSQNDTVIHVLKTYCLHFYSGNWNADFYMLMWMGEGGRRKVKAFYGLPKYAWKLIF